MCVRTCVTTVAWRIASPAGYPNCESQIKMTDMQHHWTSASAGQRLSGNRKIRYSPKSQMGYHELCDNIGAILSAQLRDKMGAGKTADKPQFG
jgi:hypothetical protein